MNTELDHLVIAARTLDDGVAWCEATLGVTPGPGGRHALMSTHNRLLSLADERFSRLYLEIIAIDPAAPMPGRPRWFGLDEPALQGALQRGPRLIHAVARSPQLDMHRFGLIHSHLEPGVPVAASRDTPAGLLQWQICLRPDGRLLCGGALPTLIQWQGVHPADAMPASGLRLEALVLRGVPPKAAQVLRLRGVTFEPAGGPALVATLHTPRGRIELASPEIASA